MKLEIMSHGEKDTFCIGKQIGSSLRGGEIILLDSDLGGGKTVLTKGIAEGIGSTDLVTSPTFTIQQIYTGKNLELYHYDLYRLNTLGIIEQEMQEFLGQPDVVVVVEWPGLAESVFPSKEVIHIKLDRQKSSETERLLTIEYPDSSKYAIDKDVLGDYPC